MIAAGMNVARLNMSHGDEASHTELVARIREAAAECATTVAIMVDTRGREIRSGRVAHDQIFLNANDDGIDYDFGENGLLPGLITKQLFLARNRLLP